MLRSVWSLLALREKIQFAALTFGIVVTSFMNIGGVASIMPFIEALTSPGTAANNPVIARLLFYTGMSLTEWTIVWIGVGVVLLFVIGNALLAFVTWKGIVFSRKIAYTLTVRLFDTYLRQDFKFYLLRNTSELMKNLFGEVNAIVNGVLKPLVELMVEGILALALIVFLFLVNPAIALVAAALLGGGYGMIFLIVRSALNRASRNKVRRNRDRYRVVSDAFGAIKELKLMALERRYTSLFDEIISRFERSKARIQGIAKLPRYVLETFAFGGILSLALLLFVRGDNAASVLPLISAYAVAGFKLLPALQRVFAAFAHIRGSHASIELVLAELSQETPELAPTDGEVLFTREIVLHDVSFTYDNTPQPALSNIDFAITKNTTVGIVGPTGCGKTTLVDLILGFHRAASGKLTVDGVPVDRENVRVWQKHFGYVPQSIYLSDASVTRNVAFGVPDNETDLERVRFAARLANLDEFVDSLADGYNTQLGERGVRISGGQRQRVGIARALYRDPDIIVFDEATSALDTHTEQAVMDAITNLMHRKTIIIIAHRLSTLRQADQVVVLNGGKVDAIGSYDELVRTHPHFLDEEA